MQGVDRTMNINLHIERFILDGFDLPSHQLPALQASMTAELGRLLAEGGLQTGLLTGGAWAAAPGGGFQMTEPGNAEQLGQEIARAVYGGIV